jgi:hypothetical protein
MNTLIVGRGEIGNSLYSILNKFYPTWCDDIITDLQIMDKCPEQIDFLHICLRYTDKFKEIVTDKIKQFKPKFINICTTVPVGTCETFKHPYLVHSTTRGLHPNLVEGLRRIPKHIGGDLEAGKVFSDYFSKAGIECVVHNRARTTELLHILNNVHYGINLIFANEASKLCREYGVDYIDYLAYTQTNNRGFDSLGHSSKVRPILTPPGDKIGGHCVVMSANLIPKEKRPVMIDYLAEYNT